jgi:hypothetical protein
MTLVVKKLNKRLVIVDGDAIFYCPPDFLRNKIKSRADLERLVEEIGVADQPIDAIMAFETRMRP